MTRDSRLPVSASWWVATAGLVVLILLACILASFLLLPVGSLTPFAGIAFAVTGGLLVIRRPENVIGRLLVSMGAVWATGESVYTLLALDADLPPAVLVFVSWLNVWAFWLMLPLATFVVALFPSGHVGSSWMRWPLRIAAAIGVASVLARMFVPVADDQQTFGEEFAGNPWAVESLTWLSPLAGILDYLIVGFLALAIVDLVLRRRRSHGIERLQMRWLALGLVVFIVLLTAAIAVEAAGVTGPVNELVWHAAWLLGLGSLPVTIGIAVARYRLYEIDRIVSRTVSYAILVVVLAGVYALGILGLGSLIGRGSPLVVAGSTLAAAAVFNPVRRRVQRWVDRRFDRQRYDARRLVDEFNIRLRDHVDLEGLVPDLIGVVDATLRPATMSIWVRDEASV